MEQTPTTRRKRYRSHPAEVTADRLKDHVEKWYDRMDGRDRDDFAHVIQILEEIAAGKGGEWRW